VLAADRNEQSDEGLIHLLFAPKPGTTPPVLRALREKTGFHQRIQPRFSATHAIEDLLSL